MAGLIVLPPTPAPVLASWASGHWRAAQLSGFIAADSDVMKHLVPCPVEPCFSGSHAWRVYRDGFLWLCLAEESWVSSPASSSVLAEQWVLVERALGLSQPGAPLEERTVWQVRGQGEDLLLFTLSLLGCGSVSS